MGIPFHLVLIMEALYFSLITPIWDWIPMD